MCCHGYLIVHVFSSLSSKLKRIYSIFNNLLILNTVGCCKQDTPFFISYLSKFLIKETISNLEVHVVLMFLTFNLDTQ